MHQSTHWFSSRSSSLWYQISLEDSRTSDSWTDLHELWSLLKTRTFSCFFIGLFLACAKFVGLFLTHIHSYRNHWRLLAANVVVNGCEAVRTIAWFLLIFYDTQTIVNRGWSRYPTCTQSFIWGGSQYHIYAVIFNLFHAFKAVTASTTDYSFLKSTTFTPWNLETIPPNVFP